MGAATFLSPIRVVPVVTSNGAVPIAPRPAVTQPAVYRGVWKWLPILASAAVVLAVLGGFFVGRHTEFAAPDPTERAPAIMAPGTPTSGADVSDAVLLDVILPAELLPVEENRITGLASLQVEAGATGTWYPTCCDGPLIEYIVAGSLTVTSHGAVQVMWAGGTLEEIAPETEFVLGPGDALITRNLISFTYANTGTDPAELLEWMFIENQQELFAGHQLPGWGGPGGLHVTSEVALFTDPVRVTVQRYVLDPGEAVPDSRPNSIRLVVSPNLETDILRSLGEDVVMAFDSEGAATLAYVVQVQPITGASEVPVVGLPPE